MPRVKQISGRFEYFDSVYSPVGYASVIAGSNESLIGSALIDTGADCIFMSVESAQTMFGISEDEVKKREAPKTEAGAKQETPTYLLEATIRLRGDADDDDFILIPNALIRVLPALLRDFTMLIGQIDGFKGRVLHHSNRVQNRAWQLREI